MNQQQAQKLLQLSEDPDILIHFSGHYVDGFASVREDENGEIVFDSHVYSGAPLKEWSAYSVTVSREIKDWWE